MFRVKLRHLLFRIKKVTPNYFVAVMKFLQRKFLWLKKLTMRQKISLAITLTVIIAAGIIIWRLKVGADITGQGITNQATVNYCTEGDAIDVCNPGMGLYSGNSVSNVATISKTTTNVDLSILLRFGTNVSQAVDNVTIQILNSSNKTVVAQMSNQSVPSDGSVIITDTNVINTLDDSATYLIRIKAPGFLGKNKQVTNILSQKIIWQVSDIPAWGDFDGDNVLTIPDLIAMIRDYNGSSDTGAQLVTSTLGRIPTIPDLITWIRQYNTNPNGE